MIKRLKQILVAGTAFGLLALGATSTMLPAVASADSVSNSVCAGTNLSFDSNSDCTSPKGSGAKASKSLDHILNLVVNLFSFIVGFIAVVMIIVGGVKYVTSGGESSNVSGAKNTIIYAIIGLIIVALAQVLVHFVLNKTGSAISTKPTTSKTQKK